jgi:3'-5' exoribonuclease
MKNAYIENLRDGVRVDDVFLISNKSIGRTQDGSAFVRLKLMDRTGSIDAIKWDAPDALCTGIGVDDYVQVRGVVGKYKDKMQLVLDGVRKHCEKIDPADFLPRCPRDIGQMYGELKEIISTIKEPQLRALMDAFFNNSEFVEKFTSAPAALKIHHAYIGGLLEHSLSVAQLCVMVAGQYPEANRDLLISGAILHDIGKIDEFAWSRSIKYTDCGHLVGHLVSGAMTVDEVIEKIPDFHPLLRMILMHMILSHHGEKEFGSPKRPKSLESLILHRVEDLDAKVKTFVEAVAPNGSHDSEMWTERHWLLDRPLFRGLPESALGANPVVERDFPIGSEESEFDLFSE